MRPEARRKLEVEEAIGASPIAQPHGIGMHGDFVIKALTAEMNTMNITVISLEYPPQSCYAIEVAEYNLRCNSTTVLLSRTATTAPALAAAS